jgi:hypothetical protein
MTELEQNKAIAEAVNWKPTTDGGICWDANGQPIVSYPQYTRDLNAMAEAEKYFDDKIVDIQSMYWDYLALVTLPDPFPGDDTFLRDFKLIRATAAQRAEAFLRTLGKWKE